MTPLRVFPLHIDFCCLMHELRSVEQIVPHILPVDSVAQPFSHPATTALSLLVHDTITESDRQSRNRDLSTRDNQMRTAPAPAECVLCANGVEGHIAHSAGCMAVAAR
jgi:hypothetical protein